MHLGMTELGVQHDQRLIIAAQRNCQLQLLGSQGERTKHLEAVCQAAGTPVGFNKQLQVLLHVGCWGSRGRWLQNHIYLCLHRSRVCFRGIEMEGITLKCCNEQLSPAGYSASLAQPFQFWYG